MLCKLCGSKAEDRGYIFYCPNCTFGFRDKQAYEWRTEYPADINRDDQWRWAKIVDTFNTITCETSLIDIGCGNGAWFDFWLSLGIEVVGIDPNPNVHNLCNQDYKNIIIVGTLPDIISSENRKIKSDNYDIANFQGSLEDIHNPVEVLLLVNDLLRDNGIVHIVTSNFLSDEAINKGANWGYMYKEHCSFWSPLSLNVLAARTGFAVVYNSKTNHISADGMSDSEYETYAATDHQRVILKKK